MATIQDDAESEEVGSSSAGDTTVESQRPQRSTRTKTTCYVSKIFHFLCKIFLFIFFFDFQKEPSITSKIRRPSPIKNIKTERESNEGKENHAPNENVEEVIPDINLQPRVRLESHKSDANPKRKSNEENRTDETGGHKKVKVS